MGAPALHSAAAVNNTILHSLVIVLVLLLTKKVKISHRDEQGFNGLCSAKTFCIPPPALRPLVLCGCCSVLVVLSLKVRKLKDYGVVRLRDFSKIIHNLV